jgi:transcriptional regulator with XRE-family HTH domain
MSWQKRVGEKLRMYRKLKRLSLEEVAARVYKSKSILSKYERGESVFDVDTLYELAGVLDIEPAQLFEPSRATVSQSSERYGVFVNNKLYAYMLVRERSFHLIKSVLVLNNNSASLYMHVSDVDCHTNCRVLYVGELMCYPGNVVIHMTNQADRSDHAVLFAAIRMNQYDTCLGMIMMSSYSARDPGVLKILLSRSPVSEEQELAHYLTIDKADVADTRRSNIYTTKTSSIDRVLFQ